MNAVAQSSNIKTVLAIILSFSFLMTACSKSEEQSLSEENPIEESQGEESQGEEKVSVEIGVENSPAYLRSEPAAGSVLARHPRTLRIFLSALPDIEKSQLSLSGNSGEVTLSGFHTMGADDLMIEIKDHPLANGNYTVSWSAIIAGDEKRHSGSFSFTVAVPQN